MLTGQIPDSTRGGVSTPDDDVRELFLLMPRLVGRAKRTPPPAQLAGLDLAPRHLNLFALMIFDGRRP
ncbi:hypothetical protein [Paractinoplanes abujensis]|uniref:Uncharacterized protein n=1 Tax=Paractinoplanes abujensis TaxID=882441 RepID=A0A7W7G0U4_9ACTN|nr:hypothetical protein [Actinoplanes abujensis]MBB4691540.1 hypothetical protein [Actinoplanes abujensis]